MAMISRFRQTLRLSPVHTALEYFRLVQWQLQKDGPPPHLYKKALIVEVARRHPSNKIFVETGTSVGDMLYGLRNEFAKLYSVELSGELFRLAQSRLSRFKNIQILQGNSADRLQEILGELRSPAIFWLDAHFSGGITAKLDSTDTPIIDEVTQIISHSIPGHVILIDDARLLGTGNGYPDRAGLERLVLSRWPDANIVLKDDVVRIFQGGNSETF